MPVGCHDILADAERILEKAGTEVQFRNVIGRAYYACYHRATAFHLQLPSPGQATDKGGVHKQLSDALANPTVKDADLARKSKQLGYMCRDLHFQRVGADYSLEGQVCRQHAEQALAQARRLFGLAESA